jgi:Mu transposase, C-terminal domain
MPVKGKDERGVGYVKSNAIAGRRFASWSELEAHLQAWTREVADVRVHGTTGETPLERFVRDEASALRPLAGTPPFISARDLLRRVGADCAIEVDGNAYSVPWRLIGERVRVTVGGGSVCVLHAGREVAVHAELMGRHGRVTNDSHLAGIAGAQGRPVRIVTPSDVAMAQPPPLLRPLAEYEAAVGGGF